MSFKRKILNNVLLLSIKIKNKVYSKRAFVFCTPIHGNLGDQAILESEIKFFKKENNTKVIDIESFLVKDKLKVLKSIIKDSTIFIQGGGFLGSVWPQEETVFRTILKEFKNNKVIVMPQTIFFESSKQDFEKESINIYSNHKDITFFCREEYSFKYMQEKFPACKIKLAPDIVLYNEPMNFYLPRKNVLFCIRNDKEKIQRSFDKIIDILNTYGLQIDYTDTVINKKIFKFNRKKELQKKFKQIAKYKMVVTDRLHGMVFAYLTKTPCLVFNNSTNKVKGLYKWLSNCNFIKLYDENNFKEDIDYLLSLKNIKYSDLHAKYNELIEEIKKG